MECLAGTEERHPCSRQVELVCSGVVVVVGMTQAQRRDQTHQLCVVERPVQVVGRDKRER